MEQQYDELYKVVLVGDPGVGKTNLLATFLASEDGKPDAVDENGVSKAFSSVKKPTIGVEFGTKIVQHPNGKRIKAQIWDTAGQERYRAITSSHYRRAAGALVVYDVTNKQSFENAQQHWLKELKASADMNSTLLKCIMMVGNKVDLEETACDDPSFVPQDLHDAAAQQLHVLDTRASARTCQNVRKAFEELIIAIYNEDKGRIERMATIRNIHLEEKPSSEKAGQKCCNSIS
ncbi:TPA: hypothetical protein N0F65_004947 [Lagenidium giganteum]|uniref:Uncharacterized protein n=1 Tax=Lagenidium giganteum TaxID=4803 RepID=A0AAV2YUD0_9STRA|nr:TPA: hypothetical protein N0F65_004947 [Lagenidium giganteum]